MSLSFEGDLADFLKGCRRLLLVGVGNTMRGDDAAGVRAVTRLRGRVPPWVRILNCGEVPENFTGEMKRAKPTHIIFVDAAEMGAKPGVFALVGGEDLATQSMSTHKQSVRTLFRLLEEGIPGVRVALACIQPKDTGFGIRLSRPVDRGLKSMQGILINVIWRICDAEDHRVEG